MAKTLEKEAKEKRFRILGSFSYAGPDGKSKQSVRLGPGEPCPELNDEVREGLLNKNLICEIGKDGENILRETSGEVVALDISACRGLVQRLKIESQVAYRYLKQHKLTKPSLLLLKEAFDETIIRPHLARGGELFDFDKDPNVVQTTGLNRWILEFKQEIDSQLLYAKE